MYIGRVHFSDGHVRKFSRNAIYYLLGPVGASVQHWIDVAIVTTAHEHAHHYLFNQIFFVVNRNNVVEPR